MASNDDAVDTDAFNSDGDGEELNIDGPDGDVGGDETGEREFVNPDDDPEAMDVDPSLLPDDAGDAGEEFDPSAADPVEPVTVGDDVEAGDDGEEEIGTIDPTSGDLPDTLDNDGNGDCSTEPGETVESSELRDIARRWIADERRVDVDEVEESTVGGLDGWPSYGVKAGRTTSSIDLPCIGDADPNDEIPVDATVWYKPGTAPKSEKTVEELIDDLADDDGEGVSGDETDTTSHDGGDGEGEYSEVDTRGLNESPEAASPNVKPEDVSVTGSVETSVKAQLNGGDAGNDVHPISEGRPADPLVTLHVRVVRTYEALDDQGRADGVNAIVAGETGMTTVEVESLYADVHDRLTGEDPDIEPGDEITLSGVEWSDTGELGFEATRHTRAVVVESDEYPTGYWLEEASELDRLGEVFADAHVDAEAWNRIADILVQEFHIKVPYTDSDDPVWWIYFDEGPEEGLWGPFGKARLETTLGDHLPYEKNTSRHRREILKNVKVRCRVEADAFNEGAPADDDLQWMVGVANGVIDLRTGELHDHDPKWRLSSKLPVEYKPNSYDGSLGDGLDWFLDDVCKTDEDQRMCIAMTAHSLMRQHQIKSAFPVLGPSNSGKTKWHGVVKRLLGYENTHTMNFDAFAKGDGFETGKILGVHAALDDDASGKKVNDLNFFKKVTGGEEVSINRKYEKLADYTPYATISWLSNDPAVLGERNSGVTSRLYPIVMPHRHTEDENDGHKDFIDETTLESRIYAEEELEALLVVAVEKAQEMYETGKIGAERTEKERWQLYDSWADGVKRFFRECVAENPGHVTPKSALYEAYKQWCEQEGLDPMSPSQFWRTARQSGPYFEADGVWFDSSTRGVRHVQLGPEGLEHAPDSVLEKLDGDGTAKHTLDTVTPISEIQPFRGPSFYTVEGTVDVGDPYEPGFIIEDDDSAVRVYVTSGRSEAFKEAADGEYVPQLANGDTVRIEKMEKDREDGRLCLQYVHGYSEITVVETTPDDDDQQPLPDDDGDDDDGELDTDEETREGMNAGDEESESETVEAEVEDDDWKVGSGDRGDEEGSDESVLDDADVEHVHRNSEKTVAALLGDLGIDPSQEAQEAVRAVRDDEQDSSNDDEGGDECDDGDGTEKDLVETILTTVEARQDSSDEDDSLTGADRKSVVKSVASDVVSAGRVEAKITTLLSKERLTEVNNDEIRVTGS